MNAPNCSIGRAAPCAVVAGLFIAATVVAACGSKERPPGLDYSSSGAAGAGGAANGGAHLDAGPDTPQGGTAGSAMAGDAGGGEGGFGGRDAPPAPECIPRQSCQALCGLFDADPAACGLGTAAECGCVCEERFGGPCPVELAALLTCAGDAPSVDCSARGRVIAGCEQESFALEICDFRAREQLCAQSYPLCSTYCQAAVQSACPRRPESFGSCLCGCEASFTAACEPQFSALMTCAGDAPSFTCDALGRPAPAACDVEWQALDACISPGSSGAPDAG